jgi:O-antigen ligase
MILFYVLVLLMPFLNPPFLSRVVSNTFAFKILGAACLLYTVFHLATRGSVPPYLRTWQSRLFGLLYLLATASFFTRGVRWRILYSYWMSYTSFVALLLVVLSIVDTLPKVRWVLLSANAAVALASVRVVEEWWQFRKFDLSYRAGMMVGDANYFSTTAALCLPFAFLTVLHSKKRWERWFYGGCLLLTLFAVMLCQSRGGTLALGAAFLYLVARSRRRFRNLMLVGVLVVPLMVISPSSPLRRFMHPGRTDRQSNEYHITAWKAGLRMIRTHPLFGIGLGNFKYMMRWYVPAGTDWSSIAHNTFLEVAAEMGLPTLGVFVGMLVFSYRSLGEAGRRARIVGDRMMYLASLALQAGFVGYLVGACFISAEYAKLFWLVIFLSMCLPHVLRVQRAPQYAKSASKPAPNLVRLQATMGEGAP